MVDIFLGGEIKKSAGFFERIFGKEESEKPNYSSLFHTSRVKITASPLMAILTESHIIGKTPTELASMPGRLKLIVSREKIVEIT
jgi:diacylglycerol kinase family enzyme